MRKSAVLLLISVAFSLMSFAQKQKSRYALIDFTKYMWNMVADTSGLIRGEVDVHYFDKEPGNAWVYMVHKNGGIWWYQQAKKNFPNTRLPFLKAAKQLIKEDSIFLKNYNKWAFYIEVV